MVRFAMDALAFSTSLGVPGKEERLRVRIGIHTGPVYSGIVCKSTPRFNLIGDTMNTAARMESSCKPNRVHVSGAFYQCLPLAWQRQFEPMGAPMLVKGKGAMYTYVSCVNAGGHAHPQRSQPRRVLSFVEQVTGTQQGEAKRHTTTPMCRAEPGLLC
jgi:class 3 adenylate cyclase